MRNAVVNDRVRHDVGDTFEVNLSPCTKVGPREPSGRIKLSEEVVAVVENSADFRFGCCWLSL